MLDQRYGAAAGWKFDYLSTKNGSRGKRLVLLYPMVKTIRNMGEKSGNWSVSDTNTTL